MAGTIICYGDSNTYGYDPCTLMGGTVSRTKPLDRYPGERNRLENREPWHLRKMHSAHRKPDPLCL